MDETKQSIAAVVNRSMHCRESSGALRNLQAIQALQPRISKSPFIHVDLSECSASALFLSYEFIYVVTFVSLDSMVLPLARLTTF